MSDDLIEFLANTTIASLELQRDRAAATVEKQRREFEKAEKSLRIAISTLELAQRALQIKQDQEQSISPHVGPDVTTFGSQNGHEPADQGTDQTAAVLRVIRAGNGLRPAEIQKALKNERIEVKPNYVSTILQRLKKRKQIEAKNGKYRAKQEPEDAKV